LTLPHRYFINDVDEVRSIENPDCYFKYFSNHNARVNERQRFAFSSKSFTLPGPKLAEGSD
jgi:hypothetical protein